jgi:hypothetical protein
VRKVQSSSGTRLLIRPSSQDAKIQFMAFMAGTGLTAADESRLSVELRKALRDSLTLVPVDLSPGFPFADFKGLGSGPNEVIALPFQLSGAGPPASGVQGLTQSFIGSSGFALAVAKEYIIGLIDVQAIRNAINGRSVVFRVDLGVVSYSVTYRLRFSSGPTLTFRTGAIEISGRIEVETSNPVAPNGFVSFKQLVTLLLDTVTELVRPQRVGDPDVDESWFIPHGRAVNIVRSEIDNALSANEPHVRDVFRDGRNRLLGGLLRFDAAARPHYTAIEISANGVIVRGEIGSAARRAPVVHISETHQAEFTAFPELDSGRTHRPLHLVVGGVLGLQHLVRRREILHRRAPLHFSQAGRGNRGQSDLSSYRRHPHPSGRAGSQRCRRNDLPSAGARVRDGLSLVVGTPHVTDLAARPGPPHFVEGRNCRPCQRPAGSAGEKASVSEHAGVFRGLEPGEASGSPECRTERSAKRLLADGDRGPARGRI